MNKDIENMTASESNPLDARQERDGGQAEWIAGPYNGIWTGIHRDLDGKWDEDEPGSGELIVSFTPGNEDTRDLIVLAVNSHESLVEALASILYEDSGKSETDRLTDRVKAAAALARARGEQS